MGRVRKSHRIVVLEVSDAGGMIEVMRETSALPVDYESVTNFVMRLVMLLCDNELETRNLRAQIRNS